MTEETFNSRVIILTLAFVILAMVCVFLAGLWDDRIDNNKILAILGPGFSAVLGYFIGRGSRGEK